jgi:preprotein translocase subunit SecF
MFKNKQFDFIKNSRIFFIISSSLIIIAILASFIMGVKVDVQFKGGTIVSYSHTGKLDKKAAQTLIEKTINEKVSVRETNDPIAKKTNMVVTLTKAKSLTVDVQNKLTKALTDTYKKNDVKLMQISNVDPTMGNEFFLKTFLAVLVASIILIIFIAIRFRKIGGWSAGVMSVIALIHDVIMVYATFVLFSIPLNDNFMAVVLTILGYSINDTIVIYDRIRENKRIMPKNTTEAELVNASINQSLSRSINTAFATILSMVVVCVVALIFNVESIISFAFPLVIGMITGVYSSICIATPLWVVWKKRKVK